MFLILWFTLIITTQISKNYRKNWRCRSKIPDVSGLVTKSVYYTKISEVENKNPNVSGVVKKADYDVKISDVEGKYITTSE